MFELLSRAESTTLRTRGAPRPPTSAEIAEGLPLGTHFLTCTIDREHTLLMHQVIVVR